MFFFPQISSFNITQFSPFDSGPCFFTVHILLDSFYSLSFLDLRTSIVLLSIKNCYNLLISGFEILIETKNAKIYCFIVYQSP